MKLRAKVNPQAPGGSPVPSVPNNRPRLPILALGLLAALLGMQAARADIERLWMVWPELRPDVGRPNPQQDNTANFSTTRILQGRVQLRTTTTPATPDAIPTPIEPGSQVTGTEIPPETISHLVKPSASTTAPTTIPATNPAKTL